jgi:hypothetical protein
MLSVSPMTPVPDAIGDTDVLPAGTRPASQDFLPEQFPSLNGRGPYVEARPTTKRATCRLVPGCRPMALADLTDESYDMSDLSML